MAETVQLYPWWLRGWHWLNAAAFLVLLVTGVSLHFAAPEAPLIAFATARILHNVAGLVMTAATVLWGVALVRSGLWRHYWPRGIGWWSRWWRQSRFYAVGIFLGEPHPFPVTADAKFNPLQQVTYLGVMGGVLPVLLLSGWWYLFPEWMPWWLASWGGIGMVAVIHYLAGLALTLFWCGHLYLATAGETVTSEFRKMILGYRCDKEVGHERTLQAGGED